MLVDRACVEVEDARHLFGGWYALSAKRRFKGPVRMGTEEELERIEEELDRTGPALAGARSPAS